MATQALLKQLYETPEQDLLNRIRHLKTKLSEQVLILGHHYQREEVFAFADATGDSLKLSQEAAKTKAPFVIFCGVHFMAETADILTGEDQIVILPDPEAGCSMADMADDEQIQRCWQELSELVKPDEVITPVTYINSTASLKAFCGEHGGIVCTSSNAEKVLEWSWKQREKILFFPDQHLGENTALAMGLSPEDMAIWDPYQPLGGLTPDEIRAARILLWKGFCSVHQLFKVEHVQAMRRKHPGIQILAHPECSREVCQEADFIGSTEAIIRFVRDAKTGSTFAIATELNLVNRLRLQHPDKPIWFLSPTICMCSTMFRTDPQHLCASLEAIAADSGEYHQVKVPEPQKDWAKVALERMLALN